MFIKLEGSPVKQDIRNKTIEAIKDYKSKGINPKLAVIRAGDEPGKLYYENAIIRNANSYGIEIQNIRYSDEVTQAYLENAIKTVNADPEVHAILLLRPFPKHIDEERLRQLLSPDKDVDAITDISIAQTFVGKEDAFYVCTAEACMEMIRHHGVDLTGKKVTVVGRSLTVGKPLAVMLLNDNATVTVCHSRTSEEDQIAACKNADIVVLATGRTESYDSRYFRNGQIIIDVGTGTGSDGKMHGDLDIAEIESSGTISDLTYTPVPGGVGTVTTALLMQNVVKAVSKM